MSEYKDPLLGALIEGYKITSLLGEGGIGRVYRATHSVIGKKIAIKALKQDFARNKTSMARLLQEAKSVNEIQHENVIDIFNLLSRPESGEAFILMELLEGKTLAEVIEQGGPLMLPLIGHLGMQVCSALYAAHQKGIFHRDLKPENIFLTQRAGQKNFVKIIDFGLAKLKESHHLTQEGTLLGTPAYMAPEQLRGEAIDARADIYALGLILYELATGEMAHPSKNMVELYDLRLKAEAPDPRAKNNALPEAFSRLVARCLAREAPRRYSSMLELAVDLAAICELRIGTYFLSSPHTRDDDLSYETETERFVPVDEALLQEDSPLQETQRVSLIEGLTSSEEDSYTESDEAALLNPETVRVLLKERKK